MRVLIEPLEQRHDERGSVFEALGADRLHLQQNVHVVLTQPGGIRGNHYHRLGTEIIVVYGPALIRLRDGEAVDDLSVAPGQALRLNIPPGVSHAVQNIGQQPNLIIAFNTVVHDPKNPDVVRDVLLEAEA